MELKEITFFMSGIAQLRLNIPISKNKKSKILLYIEDEHYDNFAGSLMVKPKNINVIGVTNTRDENYNVKIYIENPSGVSACDISYVMIHPEWKEYYKLSKMKDDDTPMDINMFYSNHWIKFKNKTGYKIENTKITS